MKTAIIVLSDPKNDDDALGRLFNALAAAWDYRNAGSEITILFRGAGTRWIAELTKPEHPANKLFLELKDSIAGVSSGCADVFGATAEVKKSGFDLISENALPGTSGLPSLQKLSSDGYTILTF